MTAKLPAQKPPAQKLPAQRWQFYGPDPAVTAQLATSTHLLPPVVQVLQNREITTLAQAAVFLDPEQLELPPPLEAFPDLAESLALLTTAIAQQHKIAICGDYDADGMTSTALLIRALRCLNGQVNYAIPSRMKEGYGINTRIIEDFHRDGVKLVLTVDNGIAAREPIARARELGLAVIVTDHHDLPPELPPANAILNPKLLPESSPYRGLAGVGVAYILAICLAQQMGRLQDFVNPLLELFTLGTIADLAPLVGVNRRWVRRGLARLPHSHLAGVQALIEVSGVKSFEEFEQLKLRKAEQAREDSTPAFTPKPNQSLKPDDIGFRLGPRINAIGRIGDPQVVIELLTTDDGELAWHQALDCEYTNQKRRQLCEEIEQEAILLCEPEVPTLHQSRVLLVMQPKWHHGVIGIVASRLVERYGVPVFIATLEDEGEIRGSARGIPEFDVFAALEFCKDLLTKHGGHRAAGGFSAPATNLEPLRQRLIQFANQCLEPEHLKPLVKVDGELQLAQITEELYQQIDSLHPWGIGNPEPIFCSRNLRVIEQKRLGKQQNHLKLLLGSPTGETQIRAIAWRWGHYCPLPSTLDLAYRLRENRWRGSVTIELEIVGIQPAKPTPNLPALQESLGQYQLSPSSPSSPSSTVVAFAYQDRPYTCGWYGAGPLPELRIRNGEGNVLVVQEGRSIGLLGKSRAVAREVNLADPFFSNLIEQARAAIAEVSPSSFVNPVSIEALQ
jgi:single-stranded-DNA-specific exonuclease